MMMSESRGVEDGRVAEMISQNSLHKVETVCARVLAAGEVFVVHVCGDSVVW
jgi:hypothetical protein